VSGGREDVDRGECEEVRGEGPKNFQEIATTIRFFKTNNILRTEGEGRGVVMGQSIHDID
jgi:hypothetical protein